LFMVFPPALILIFLVLAKRLARKSISDMIYLVTSEILNLNSVGRMRRWRGRVRPPMCVL